MHENYHTIVPQTSQSMKNQIVDMVVFFILFLHI